MIMDDFTERKKFSTFRQDRSNPFDHRCVLALKRVCGVCTHFQGALKDQHKSPCGFFGYAVHPQGSASKCHRFERKTDAKG